MSDNQVQSIWLAEAGDNYCIAFAGSSIKEFAMNAACQKVPLADKHCSQMVRQQDSLVPVFDIASAQRDDAEPFYAVLFLRSGQSAEQGTIGLHLVAPPRKVSMASDEFEAFDPGQCGHWKNAAVSGYCHEGQHIPLIDPAAMQSRAFLDDLVHFSS